MSTRARIDRAAALATTHAPAQPKGKRPTPLEFIESLSIDDKVTGAAIPFRLWDSQREMLRLIVESERLVLVKARQLGASWLALAYMLYLATFEQGQLYLVARQSLEESAEGIVRLRRMLASVPERWRCEATTDNVFSIALATGSRIRALSSTKSVGRGLASRYVIADELAFWSDSESQFAALEPGAQRLHVISTGAGPHDFFHRLYLQAVSGEGRFVPAFFSWRAHPERDDAWWRANVELAASPTLARREYCERPEDAFTSPSGVWAETFSSERNVDDIEPVPNWQTVRGIDWGYHSPAALFLQLSPAGQPFIVHEYLPHDLVTNEFVAGILREEAKLALAIPPHTSYVDPAGAQVNVQVQTPEVEAARRAGLAPVYRHSLIREGCTRIMDALADPELPLVVSTRCPFLIEALSSAKVDPNKEGEYLKDGYYEHCLDALRMIMLHLRLGPVPEYNLPEPTPGPGSGLWGPGGRRIW